MRILIMLLLFVSASAQERVGKNNLPEPVRQGFLKLFPGARIKAGVVENKDGAYLYEVEGRRAGREVSAVFKVTAQSLEYSEDIDLEQLPNKAREVVLKEVGSGKILEIERNFKDGQVSYEVEFKRDKKTYELTLNSEGDLVSCEED